MNRLPALVLCIASAGAALAGQPDATMLQRNPFVPPPAVNKPVPAPVARAATVPGDVVEDPEPEFELLAVLSGANQSLANIDGRIVAVGDRVQGYRVASILEQQVVLKRRGNRIVLALHPQSAED